jgi:hypothetical protein
MELYMYQRKPYNDLRGRPMAYETFARPVTRTDNPTLSVLPDGRITLNAASSRLFQGAGIKVVTILWDRSRCGIALRTAAKGDPNAYSIAFSRGRSASISAKAFLSYIGWSARQRQTVPANWDLEHGMLEAEIPSRFVRQVSPDTDQQPPNRATLARSPGASGNIRNWMALNEPVPRK